MRFELTTLTLARLCSTPELRPHPWVVAMYKLPASAARGKSRPAAKSAAPAESRRTGRNRSGVRVWLSPG